jgi:hypothetical protein
VLELGSELEVTRPGKGRRANAGRLAVAAAVCTAVVFGVAPAASAATGGSATNKDVCRQAASAADLTRGLGAPAQPLAATSPSKKGLNLFGPRPTAAQLAETAAHDAEKRAWSARSGATRTECAGRTANASVAPAYASSATLPAMVQYRQSEWYFCGPAAVAEMSATVPGPSVYNLNQYTVASYTGTSSPNGTTWNQEVNGLNKYVGVPDFNRNFYAMAGITDPPTAQESAAFDSNLAEDIINQHTPIVGLAEEVAYGPHLVGHPADQTIGHFIEIGGYNASQVWYADSYTNWGWAGVAPYSWFDKWTMKEILSDAGYIW